MELDLVVSKPSRHLIEDGLRMTGPFFLHHFIDCYIGYVLEKTARGVALRSFSITRNSQGPSLVPCGTPRRTGAIRRNSRFLVFDSLLSVEDKGSNPIYDLRINIILQKLGHQQTMIYQVERVSVI